jgi:hypothetical protein
MKNEYIKFDYKDNFIKTIILNSTEDETHQDYNFFKSLNLLALEACGDYKTDNNPSMTIIYSDGRRGYSGNPLEIEQFIYDNLLTNKIPFEDLEIINVFIDIGSPFLAYNLPTEHSSSDNLYEKFANTIMHYQKLAHTNGKNLLVLVADTHSANDSFLINLLSLKAAAANHINDFYIEFANADDFNSLIEQADLYSSDMFAPFIALNTYAQDKLNMTIKYVDPEQENENPLVRYLAMNGKVAELSKQNDAIYIVGGAHIAQLLACSDIKESADILTIFPERLMDVNSCEMNVTIASTDGNYLVANIIGNPFYLTYEQIYDLVV